MRSRPADAQRKAEGRHFGADRQFGSERKFEAARFSNQPTRPNEHRLIASSKLVLAELVDQAAEPTVTAQKQKGRILERCASTEPRLEHRQFGAGKKFGSSRQFTVPRFSAGANDPKRAPGSVIGSSRMILASLVETDSAPQNPDGGDARGDGCAGGDGEAPCTPTAHAEAVPAERRALEHRPAAHHACADAAAASDHAAADGLGRLEVRVAQRGMAWKERRRDGLVMGLSASMPDLAALFRADRDTQANRNTQAPGAKDSLGQGYVRGARLPGGFSSVALRRRSLSFSSDLDPADEAHFYGIV